MKTGLINRRMLQQDAEHNGVDHMLADVAEARKNGVMLTARAEEYLRECCATGLAAEKAARRG